MEEPEQLRGTSSQKYQKKFRHPLDDELGKKIITDGLQQRASRYIFTSMEQPQWGTVLPSTVYKIYTAKLHLLNRHSLIEINGVPLSDSSSGSEAQECSDICRHAAAMPRAQMLQKHCFDSYGPAAAVLAPHNLLAAVHFIPESRQEAGAGAPLPVLVLAPEAEGFDRACMLSFPS